MKIINFKKKKMKLLAEEHQESCYIYRENFENKYVKDKKNIVKFEIIVIIQGNIEVLRIAYAIQNIMYLIKFLQFFVMDLTMIIILS